MSQPANQVFRSGVTKQQAIEGFEWVLCRFRKSELDWFINRIASNDPPPAGPLLLQCVTTIDYMGGVTYGFRSLDGKNNTTERFIRACNEMLGFATIETDFLLQAVRHAMVHGGITEGSFDFTIGFNPVQADVITDIHSDGRLVLFAGSLARRVRQGIDLMEGDKGKWVNDRPGEGTNRVWQNDYETKPGYSIRRLADENKQKRINKES